MTGPSLDDLVRASVADGLAAIDWETRCARAEGQRDAARDLVCDIAGYAQNPQIPMPRALHERLCAAVRIYSTSEARGDDAPSPVAGSGGGPPAPAHHPPTSDDDRVIVVLTRAEAAVMLDHIDAIARVLGDELAQSFDATAAAHGNHSAGAAFHPPVRSGAIDDADTPLTPDDLSRIAMEAAARHLEGAPADVTPLEVMTLVQMARGAR